MVGALGEWPDVKVVQNCNENGVCDNNENHSNCPQDCRPIEQKAQDNNLLLIGGLVVLIIVIGIWWFLKKK
jgi:LPXTG-motif cell wall-anchored protein